MLYKSLISNCLKLVFMYKDEHNDLHTVNIILEDHMVIDGSNKFDIQLFWVNYDTMGLEHIDTVKKMGAFDLNDLVQQCFYHMQEIGVASDECTLEPTFAIRKICGVN